MLSDPQSITVNGVAQSLPRIQIGTTNSLYQKSDGTFKLTISHTHSKGRVRSLARIDQIAVAADPVTAVNKSVDLGVYFVLDRPDWGFTQTQIEQLSAALTAWLTTANVDKLYATEF